MKKPIKYTIYLLLSLGVIYTGYNFMKNSDQKILDNKPGYEEVKSRSDLELATLAGGCFWCLESVMEGTPGVVEAFSGYSGGDVVDPTYEQVIQGQTGHKETVQVFYDPKVIGYRDVLDVFWRSIDPTNELGQFTDQGPQYRTAVFYHSDEQRRIAAESKRELEDMNKFDRPVVTEILPFRNFYLAEDYHQDYYIKSRLRYKAYEQGSGRESFRKQVWGDGFTKPSDERLKQSLTPLQYRVTQQDGTERAFDNEYWDEKRDGIYVDVVSGEPLFSSLDKFESGTGWPSFTKPLEHENIEELPDTSLGMARTEARSRNADSHLGHVFDDGPPESGGQRYCINSAALRFIPKDKLQEEGYGEYLELFE